MDIMEVQNWNEPVSNDVTNSGNLKLQKISNHFQKNVGPCNIADVEHYGPDFVSAISGISSQTKHVKRPSNNF